MKRRLQKPMTWLMATTMIAMSLPVAAIAAPTGASARSAGFELPINGKISERVNSEAILASTDGAPVPGARVAQSWTAAEQSNTGSQKLASTGDASEHAGLVESDKETSSLSTNESKATAPSATAPSVSVESSGTIEETTTNVAANATETLAAPSTNSSSDDVLSIEDAIGAEQVENLSGAVKEDAEVTESAENPLKEGEIIGNALVIEKDGVLIIDNDYDVTQEKEFQWEKFEDAPGLTKIEAGARLPVVLISSLTSKTAKLNDAVEARLKHDITIGGKPIASKGDKVLGHVSSCMRARRILHAELSKNRWMRANGCLGIQFDEIITSSGEHLPLEAMPARQARIVKNKNEGRVLGVNAQGEVASPLSTQLKHQAAHLAIRGAASAAGVFSMGIVPVAYGVVGAMNPSFAFLQPVGKNVPHRRLKGFAMGVVSGLPGGFLIADMIIRGKEAEVLPGDEFLVEFKQDFTGEAASSASIIPGSQQNVRGEVVK